MTKRLNTTIFVKGPNEQRYFGPDDVLPDWAVHQLEKDGTPGIWAEEGEADAQPSDSGDFVPRSAYERLQKENEALRAEWEAMRAQLDAVQEGTAEGTENTEGATSEEEFVDFDPKAALAELDDLEAKSYDELKALAKERDIKTGGQSKAELIEALRAGQ